jgi:signal transduction histidine kinase
MKSKLKQKKKKSILIKIFSVILALTLSIILFILAFWGILSNRPNGFYAHIHLAITLVILVAVGSMVSSFIIRKILKPLSILNDAVEKVGKGHLDQNIPVKSNDELGSLTIAFNQMTSDLRKMILAREQLLLDVSHELRSPITRAKLALEMIPDSTEKESLADDLKEMERMITGILESEQLKNGTIIPHLSTVYVGDILQKLMSNYQRENNRIILFAVSADLVIEADEDMILIVLRNLVDNALKYSTLLSKPIEISVILNRQTITIQIEDFGQGIPEDKLPYVFEPFYRVDQSRSRKTGGYGLGLHLCKRIMDLHKAEIKLTNKYDRTGIIASLHFNRSPKMINVN